MPLTNSALPAVQVTRSLPIDVNMVFAQNQTFTASGALNNGGSTVQIDLQPGRFMGFWAIDLSSLKVSAGNEVYQLALLGSNDPAWGNDNCELLAFHDWAAAPAGRLVPIVCGASPVVPAPSQFIRRYAIPFTNLLGDFQLRYVRAYLIAGGTSPSVKLTSWIAYNSERV